MSKNKNEYGTFLKKQIKEKENIANMRISLDRIEIVIPLKLKITRETF